MSHERLRNPLRSLDLLGQTHIHGVVVLDAFGTYWYSPRTWNDPIQGLAANKGDRSAWLPLGSDHWYGDVSHAEVERLKKLKRRLRDQDSHVWPKHTNEYAIYGRYAILDAAWRTYHRVGDPALRPDTDDVREFSPQRHNGRVLLAAESYEQKGESALAERLRIVWPAPWEGAPTSTAA